MKLPFSALRHRNFALFVSGQVCALIGYWIQMTAQSWLLYRLTGSATLLGVLAFASSIPILVLSPLAGLWSDRANLHRLMFATQILEGLQAATLAGLALAGIIAPWHIITLSMIMGVLVAVELPVRHAYLLELVGDRRDLPNAVAVTSLVANCGRMVGPAVAGFMIGIFSEAVCFLVNALTYLAVIVTFLFIRVTPSERAPAHAPMLKGLTEGIAYAWHNLPIRALLGMLMLVAVLAAPYNTLMPVVVQEVFGGDASQMGLLIGSAGAGAIAGTLYLASRNNVRGLIHLIARAALAAGCAITVLAWATNAWSAVPLLVVIGFGILATTVSSNMIFQTIVDDDKRGRVMSLYTAAFLGVAPFGNLAAGALADAIGIKATLTIGGLGCAAGALYLLARARRLNAHVQPVYDRLGIPARK